ncbi:MAG: ribonuclease [Nocardioidaceae bacterium]|nr:ribonuclease [Nocardioidaceae bacterium]
MSTETQERVDAPSPDAEKKPDSPTDITKPSWVFVLRKTLREFSKDQCTDLAAALTYYSVLALFPTLIAMLSLVGIFGQGQATIDALFKILDEVGADALTQDPIGGSIRALGSSQGAGLALFLGLATSLWSASGYVGAFGRAMNRMYEVDEGRPIWKLRPVQLLVTLVTVVLVAAIAMALALTGTVAESVGSAIGLGSTFVTVWDIAKWPVMLVVVVLIVALLYYSTPNVQQPKFRWISIGAAFAIVAIIVMTALFGLYVANFSSYGKTYGKLAGVVVFLLWVWLTNVVLLFGAELDAELERGRELQAGIKAERTLQLPPRDTRNIEKSQATEEKDVERGRQLRLSRGGDDEPKEGD